MEIKCYSSLMMINNGTGKYEFDVYRKDAITNVQAKPKSCHDPRILQGIFKGFVHRAMIIWSDKYIKDELAFFKNVFVENGYKENMLRRIIEEATSKSTQQNTKIAIALDGGISFGQYFNVKYDVK